MQDCPADEALEGLQFAAGEPARRLDMKSILFTLILLLAGAAHAELEKECPWNCRLEVDYIDAKYFPLSAPNAETRQEAIRDVKARGMLTRYLKVKMRALEALKPSTYAINQRTRELALRAVNSVAVRSNDETVEYKALQILAHSLKADNSQIRLLAGIMIASIGSRSDQKMTQNVASHLIESSSDVQVLKTMLANQAK